MSYIWGDMGHRGELRWSNWHPGEPLATYINLVCRQYVGPFGNVETKTCFDNKNSLVIMLKSYFTLFLSCFTRQVYTMLISKVGCWKVSWLCCRVRTKSWGNKREACQWDYFLRLQKRIKTTERKLSMRSGKGDHAKTCWAGRSSRVFLILELLRLLRYCCSLSLAPPPALVNPEGVLILSVGYV